MRQIWLPYHRKARRKWQQKATEHVPEWGKQRLDMKCEEGLLAELVLVSKKPEVLEELEVRVPTNSNKTV